MKDRHLIALLVLVALYTAVFATLWILRHRALFSYEFQDDAARNQMIYNTLRGAPFHSSLKGVYLAGHVSITWALLALPSLIYPGIETACVVLTLALALTAVPVYLVARSALGSRFEALLLGAAALLYAPLHAVNLHTLNAVTPAVPLLAWAFWAFHARRLKTFYAFAFIAMLCKEDVALPVMLFGFYALLRRRRWPWVAVPIAVAVVYLVVAFKVLLPGTYADRLAPTTWLIGARESQAAGGPGGAGGALAWVVDHPAEALGRMLAPDRGFLFAQLLLPVALVCFLAPGALLMALPAVGMLLMHSAGHRPALDDPLTLYHRHWIAPLVPFILMATALGSARAKRFLVARGWRGAWQTVLAAVVVGCLASNLGPNIIGHPRTEAAAWPAPPPEMLEATTVYAPVFYRPTARSREAWALIRQIPAGSPVAASGDLLVPLSARRVLYEFPCSPGQLGEVDYVLIHAQRVYFGAGRYGTTLTPEEVRQVTAELRGPGWRVMDQRDTAMVLLGRVRAGDR